MCALVLSQVPYSHVPTAVTSNKFSLIWMNDNVIDRMIVIVIPLDGCAPCIPYLYGPIFGTSDHPFALAVKCYTSDVASMSFECQHRTWVRRADVVKLHVLITRRGEPTLIGRDAQPVDLGVWMLDGTGADSR